MSLQEDLREMHDAVDDQVEGLEDQLAQIDQRIEELEGEVSVIENNVMTKAANELVEYLDSTKVLELEQIHGIDATSVIGPTYNDLNNIDSATLTDWKIIDSTANIFYKYNGIGWDNDSKITKYIFDWNFGKDYLIHPLDTFNGDYGLYPNIDALNLAKNTLESTKNKINNSKAVFEDYI